MAGSLRWPRGSFAVKPSRYPLSLFSYSSLVFPLRTKMVQLEGLGGGGKGPRLLLSIRSSAVLRKYNTTCPREDHDGY